MNWRTKVNSCSFSNLANTFAEDDLLLAKLEKEQEFSYELENKGKHSKKKDRKKGKGKKKEEDEAEDKSNLLDEKELDPATLLSPVLFEKKKEGSDGSREE